MQSNVLIPNTTNSYHVFHDVMLDDTHGNIDYVVVSHRGICAIEVKNHSDGSWYSKWYYKEKQQTKAESRHLYGVLNKHGIHHWITGVLVRADRDTMPYPHQGVVEVVGVDQLNVFLTTQMPAHSTPLSDDDVTQAIAKLDKFTNCRTHSQKSAL